MSETFISMVSCAADTKTRDISVEKVLEGIRIGGKNLKGEITRIRNRFEAKLAFTCGDLKAAKLAVASLKKALPGVMWSGQFRDREQPVADKLQKHSGLFIGDFDDLSERLPLIRKKLEASPHVFALFLSPSGNGLKVVFRVRADASKHATNFRAVEAHVKQLTGIKIDESGKDIGRLCFMSYDPDIYVNENAIEIEPLPEPEKPKSAFNSSGAVNLSERQRIATELLGGIDWQSETSGFCMCPGKHLHTTGDGERDCEIHLDGAPNIFCFHKSCKGIEAGVNHELQSRIGKAEFVPASENETITRLAAFSPVEYDRVRKDEAKKLNCRVSILDSQVEAKRLSMRPPSDGDNLQGAAVIFTDIEPWPEPVNGAEILDAISKRFEHYAVLPDGAADTLALWSGSTHCYNVFSVAPRLNIRAPTEECGKTTVRNCTSLFCSRPVRTDNMTTAVMFRLVSAHSPTILTDECDKWLFTNPDLVGLVCSGHEKGGVIMRCEGESNDLRKFNCFAPFVLSAIGVLPSQLHSRSICIRLERATRDEIKTRARLDFDRVEHETELNRKLTRWITDNRERIASCDAKLPEQLYNRVSDNWRPLFKIAVIAGGDWPRRCADALAQLTGGEAERENLRVMLLTDIREVFTAEQMFTKDLVDALVEMKERPWPEVQKGKPITARWLARNLAAFEIRSGNIWNGETKEQAKGYERAQFDKVFARYIPENADIPPAGASNRPIARENPENSSVQNENVWTLEKEPIHEAYGRLDVPQTGISGKKGKI